jgi:hypothetical protein
MNKNCDVLWPVVRMSITSVIFNFELNLSEDQENAVFDALKLLETDFSETEKE